MKTLLLLLTIVFSTLAAPDDSCYPGFTTQPTTQLSNGVIMPLTGVGLAAMKGELTRESVRGHIRAGFRLLDGAESTDWYDDASAGDEVGKIEKLQREDLFIVTKVHPLHLSHDGAFESVNRLMELWNHTAYLDLVLLHYPECGSWIPQCKKKTGGDWMAAWKALEEHYNAGRIRSLGVSNFNVEQLNELWGKADVRPHVIQTWMDPFHQARDIMEFAVEHGIRMTSYSSLGTQWLYNNVKRNLVFENHILKDIAQRRGVSITTVVLAWLLKKGIAVIPRSTTREHIEENAKLLEPGYFESIIDPDTAEEIDQLDGRYDEIDPQLCQKVVEDGKCGPDFHGRKCIDSCW